MADWSPPVAPRPPRPQKAQSAQSAIGAQVATPANSVSDAEWEYRLRSLNRRDRFERTEDAHSNRLWCLMLTLMILCGAAVLVAVVVAAFVFMSQNQKN